MLAVRPARDYVSPVQNEDQLALLQSKSPGTDRRRTTDRGGEAKSRKGGRGQALRGLLRRHRDGAGGICAGLL